MHGESSSDTLWQPAVKHERDWQGNGWRTELARRTQRKKRAIIADGLVRVSGAV